MFISDNHDSIHVFYDPTSKIHPVCMFLLAHRIQMYSFSRIYAFAYIRPFYWPIGSRYRHEIPSDVDTIDPKF